MLIAIIKQNYLSYKTKIYPWIVIFSAATFLFLTTILQNIFNSISPYLINNYHFTTAEIGLLFACYYYADALLVLPAGIIIDQLSVKKIILFSLLILNISTLGFSLTNSIIIMAIARIMLGIAGAFSGISYFKLLLRWLPPQQIGLASGIINAFTISGGLFAQAPMVLLLTKFGWQNGLLLNFWLGMLLLILAKIFISDFPTTSLASHNKQNIKINYKKIGKQLATVILNPQNWIIGLYSSFASLPGIFLGASLGNLYLQQVYNLTTLESSYITSIYFIGYMTSAPFIGFISDKLHNRKLPLMLSVLFILFSLLILLLLPKLTTTTLALIILFFIIGASTSFQVLYYPLIAESNPKELTGTTIGFICTLNTLTGFYLYLLSLIINIPVKTNSVIAHPTLKNYHMAIVALIITSIISLLLALIIKEKNCKHLK